MAINPENVQVPQGWTGSVPEWLTYESLQKVGKIPGQDFTYQSPLLGGRIQKGGVVIDFDFSNPPDLAINVQGVYFHYQFGVETSARDKMARAQLAGEGKQLIFIDEDDLYNDTDYYVLEALRYRDHSRLGGG
jgi:hypothetical protein|tara:strand:+ start:316 stop:714 length:399 start_codon:yes stop_codon:yes gene_type:complete